MRFSGIFVKLSKEWDPPVWLVPSSNVSFQPVLLFVSSPSSFFFFFYIKLSLLTNLELSFPFLCGIRERESKTRDQKLCRRQGIRETMSNWAQARSWDIWTMRSEALPMIGDSRNDVRLSLGQIMRHVDLKIVRQVGRSSIFWLRFFFFFNFVLLLLFFGDVGFGCGFPVHSFGFFVWLLVVLMVVESRFIVVGGDETGWISCSSCRVTRVREEDSWKRLIGGLHHFGKRWT